MPVHAYEDESDEEDPFAGVDEEAEEELERNKLVIDVDSDQYISSSSEPWTFTEMPQQRKDF